ncbi:uncharacterized protein B0P05DRAFT_455649, partial [Gilbertella persicaria]|uniref:uncharacterized protein n=1 Tax=Gilbertella persicaria TaxID=101096 RepID=UPI00221ECEEB
RSNLFANEAGPYFSSTKSCDNLYSSDKQTLLSVRVQSKMDRGFFLADNDWTCYRRNYFQVSSVFSVHGFNHYYSVNEPRVYVRMEEDGSLQPVQRFLLGISARVANSDKEIELIQHTPKRDKGPQFKPEPKPITPGGNLTMSSVANNQNIVTFERVQFKTATANNGKRRAAQQYYICIAELFAETDRNQLVKIAYCQSAPLVVRGRSPGHYADNQELHDASHSDPYANEVYHNNPTPTSEEPKMPHHFHMQQTGPIESPHSGYDWQRARYNSSSSGSSSVPSP